MKLTKALPVLAIALCVPGIVLRALHLLNGFDLASGLPTVGDRWVWYCAAFFVLCAVLYAVLAAPLRARSGTLFEGLLGTDAPLFRMLAAAAGLLLIAGGLIYLYLTMTTAEQDAAGWARILEIVYAVATVGAGAALVILAPAQGREMTAASAKLTLAPLLWCCLHLLVTYRMTCIDPKLPSFAFGLVADVVLVMAFYHLARLLYGKPRPAMLGFFGALAVTMSFSDLGGYGLARLMGVHAVSWSAKMVLRGGLSAAACLLLAAELGVLAARRTEQ
ncbi:MAG: hypothetical protein Q4C72_09895 [Eubacteriales bacterium]|nr:hypothetical protein [Eubacteriales bacterium]